MNIQKDINHGRRVGIISLLIPSIAFIASLIIPGILILDYVHVLFGALWTGVDVFLGFIFFIVLSGMEDKLKSDIAFRLIPMLLYFIPAISVLTPLLGFALALRENIFTLNFIFIAIITISIVLGLVSFVVIVPAMYKIYKGFKNNSVNENRNGKFLMRVTKAATLQMVLQIIIISLMAYIVVYGI